TCHARAETARERTCVSHRLRYQIDATADEQASAERYSGHSTSAHGWRRHHAHRKDHMITTDVLSEARRAAVGELLEATTAHDGVAAPDAAARPYRDGDGAQHPLITRTHPSHGERERVIGSANLLADGTVQGMVDPGHRRHGHGSALLRAVLELRPDAGVWAHGALEGSLAFLRGPGLRESRHLLAMRRPLGAEHPLPEVTASTLPGRELDTFRAERDADQWVTVNAEAFADHPEQGSMTRADLDRRRAE